MRVLITGGTGVVGASAVRAIADRGHSVRVLSRHVATDPGWIDDHVERWPGDVTQAESLRGGADDCAVVLHMVGVVDDASPAADVRRVNVDGTRNVLAEAERAGVRKLVYVSSLGAEHGTTDYHRSKHAAEEICRTFAGGWVILRPGAVYGPGDQHISMLLHMLRALPAIPTIEGGDQPFQPIWHEDLAEALASALERDDVNGMMLDVAGAEVTSQNDLVRRISSMIGREVPQIPLPEMIASLGLRALDAIGFDTPISASTVTMIVEGNRIPPGRSNALIDVFGINPISLDVGLRRLLDEQPEQLPDSGVGVLRRKRFWTDIRSGRFDPDELFEYVRTHFGELVPGVIGVNAEGRESAIIDEGATLTLDLPLRGHVQVRVAELDARRMTFLTVAGHPIAGVVRFLVEERGEAVRFEIQVYDRAARPVDLLLMRTVGDWLQRFVWSGLVENVVRVNGGSATPVESVEDELSETEATRVTEWATALRDRLAAARNL
jgi:NADH dehydrogenase